MSRKNLVLLLALCVLVVALSGCASKESSSDSQEKIVILADNFDYSKGFYPVFTESTSENSGFTNWGHNIYDNLLKYEDGQIIGSLAESWEIDESGKIYTFHLREGVKFSDGSDFTAQAVKLSFEQAIKNLGMFNGSFGRLTSLIVSMETPDDHTFVMEISQPYYGTLNDLTMYNPLAIVNPKAFETDPFEACRKETMGTGPYMYDSDQDGKLYKFVRNPHYWGDKPEADGFIIKVIRDDDSKILALRSGEIDAIIGSSRLSYDAYQEMVENGEFMGKVNDKGNLTNYIGMNLSKEPFNDARLRQAVSHAIDRNLISEKIYYGINAPTLTLFEKSKPFCDVDLPVYEYNTDKAKALLDQAGWIDADNDGIREKDGQKLEFTMPYTNDFGNRDDIMVAIAGQLGEVGIYVQQEGMEMLAWLGLLMEGNYNITFYKTYGGAYDPTTVLTNMNPEVATDPVIVQVSGLLPQGLIEELDSTADTDRVQEIYEEVLGIVAQEAAVVPVDTIREFGIWKQDKIADYNFPDDSLQVEVANFKFK